MDRGERPCINSTKWNSCWNNVFHIGITLDGKAINSHNSYKIRNLEYTIAQRRWLGPDFIAIHGFGSALLRHDKFKFSAPSVDSFLINIDRKCNKTIFAYKERMRVGVGRARERRNRQYWVGDLEQIAQWRQTHANKFREQIKRRLLDKISITFSKLWSK